jgi:hypothetical protein
MCSPTLYNTDLPGQRADSAVRRSAGGFSKWSGVLATTLMLTGGLGCLIVAAQTVDETAVINREYTIKAAFLYHFLTYVEWPPQAFDDPKQPFVIGVFKTDPFGDVLDKIARTKTAAGRPIEVRRLNTMDDLTRCHILFVPRSVPAATQDALLAAIRGSHVLSVGESDDFVDRGGAAQFFLEGNKVRFAFNTDVVEDTNLKISSKLLSLAKAIPEH